MKSRGSRDWHRLLRGKLLRHRDTLRLRHHRWWSTSLVIVTSASTRYDCQSPKHLELEIHQSVSYFSQTCDEQFEEPFDRLVDEVTVSTIQSVASGIASVGVRS